MLLQLQPQERILVLAIVDEKHLRLRAGELSTIQVRHQSTAKSARQLKYAEQSSQLQQRRSAIRQQYLEPYQRDTDRLSTNLSYARQAVLSHGCLVHTLTEMSQQHAYAHKILQVIKQQQQQSDWYLILCTSLIKNVKIIL